MTSIKQFSEINKDDVAIAGGKGASLGEMTQANIPVPSGFVITADLFTTFLDEHNIEQEIQTQFSQIDPHNLTTVDRASNVIRRLILDAPMSDELQKEVLSSFDQLGAEFVAVRSSATAEDSKIASWAGELDTFLNTPREHLIDRVKECWASLFTPRAIFYRFEKELHNEHVAVAVVVQKMIASEIAGVTFTVHPVTENDDHMIIEAGFGLGEALVSGQITPDNYTVSKATDQIVDMYISTQKKKLERFTDQDGEKTQNEQNIWIALSETDGSAQKLTNEQVLALANICKNVELHYGFPCDIEWAFAEGNFYITQSRPITTLTK